jgi:hypothetical protein
MKVVGDEKSTILQDKVDEYFHDGVTFQGNEYFLRNSRFNDTSADIELIFELVRRDECSDKNSRFQSFLYRKVKGNIYNINNKFT